MSLPLYPVPFRRRRQCQEVIDSFLPLAEVKSIELAFEFPQEIIVLNADPLLFRRVLENLLENAIKYSPPQKSVILQVQVNEKELRFAVKDQGPGIPPKDVPHIFEIFYRAGTAGPVAGFGLGLATVERDHQSSWRPHLGRYRSRTGQHLALSIPNDFN